MSPKSTCWGRHTLTKNANYKGVTYFLPVKVSYEVIVSSDIELHSFLKKKIIIYPLSTVWQHIMYKIYKCKRHIATETQILVNTIQSQIYTYRRKQKENGSPNESRAPQTPWRRAGGWRLPRKCCTPRRGTSS